MNVQIRQAEAADVERLARIDNSIATDRVLVVDGAGDKAEATFSLRWQQAKSIGARRAPQADAVYIAEKLSRADRFWLAESDGKVIGRLVLTRWDWHPSTGEIDDIAVDNERRYSKEKD